MSLDSDIARGQALLAANDMPGLGAILPQLEEAKPTTEAQWTALCAIFAAINRPPWVEIMTERFMFQQPTNVSAQLQHVVFMSQAELRRDEALRKLDDLTRLKFDQPEHYVKLSEIFTNCEDSKSALVWLRKAKAAYPDNTHLWIVTVQTLIRLRQPSKIKAELASLHIYSRGKVDMLLTVATMALWFNFNALTLNLLKEIEPLLDPDKHQDRALFMVYAQRVGRFDLVLRHLPLLDIRQISTLYILEELYRTLEGRGQHDAERTIVAVAVERFRNDEAFLNRAQALAAPRLDFMSVPKVPVPEAKPPGRLSRLMAKITGP